MNTWIWIRVVVILLGVAATAGGGMARERIDVTDIGAAQWQDLRAKTLYFAHQSVGENIINGIEQFTGAHPAVGLKVREYAGAITETGALYHSRVGANSDYRSKLEEFKAVVLAEPKIELAFLKFCYLDVDAETDLDAMLGAYGETMAEIQKMRPGLRLVHVTVPLTVSTTSWKTRVKQLLGRDAWEYADNLARNRYNALLRKRYAGKEPVFDLALAESGQGQAGFTVKGQEYQMLMADYSNDGGHLNDEGRRAIAQQLLAFLATEAGQ
jgi:hypothetical protein